MKTPTNKVFIALSLLTGFFLASCSGDNHEVEVKQTAPVSVTVATAIRQTGGTIQASGQIEAKEKAVISTRVMGFITSVKVKAGDQVKKGQLLATISNADITAKKAQASAMLSEADAALKDAQKDYERYAELFRQNSASSKEFENATLHYNSVKAKAEAARQMQNEAEAMLAYTNLTAPFSGVITQKNIDAGSMANPGMPMLVIEQPGNYQVAATISEADIANVKQGAEAQIVIKSTGKLIKGIVTEVSPSSTFSGGQYVIKVTISESDKADVYSGMYATVSIPTTVSATKENIALVPASAIVYKDQLTGLYTTTENQTALLRWVRLGKVQGDHVEITSGLRSDEQFILKSEGKLYNGAPIIIK